MKNALIFAGAVAALALTSAPAQAATPTTQATATARIVQPLTITSVRDLDLGTIVLSGTAPYTDTVGITRAGVFSCGAPADLTCSGTTKSARYTMTGTRDQRVTITVSPTINLVNGTQASPDLVMTVDAPATALLDGTGVGAFNMGGSISVSDTTVDGVYVGTFDVSADYQ
jgi:hypothetical protein